jgi:hypothetical protein
MRHRSNTVIKNVLSFRQFTGRSNPGESYRFRMDAGKQREGYKVSQNDTGPGQTARESGLAGSLEFLQHGAAPLADGGICFVLAHSGRIIPAALAFSAIRFLYLDMYAARAIA